MEKKFGKYDPQIREFSFVDNNPIGSIDGMGLASVAIYDGADQVGSGSSGKSKCSPCKRASGIEFKMAAELYDYSINSSSVFSAIPEVEKLVQQNVLITELYIIDHGYPGSQSLGNEDIAPNAIVPLYRDELDRPFRDLARHVQENGLIILMGCEVAKGEIGKWYLKKMEEYADGRTIIGCNGDMEYTSFGAFFHLSQNV